MLRQIALPFILSIPATSALAERIESQAQTSHATVFPQGAVIEWSVDLAATPGAHELVLPNMPQGIDLDSLRIESDTARIGAIAVQTHRALPDNAPETPQIIRAREAVAEARAELISFDAEIAAHEAAAEAWRERAGMTRDLMQGDNRIAAQDLREIIDEAGGMVSEFLERAANEAGEAALKSTRREKLERELNKAESALGAVLDSNADSQTLLVTLDMPESDASLRLTAFSQSAGWSPNYDLDLNRNTGEVSIDRGLLVWQSTGGDWQDVTLALSTARPQGQSAPTEVPSYFPDMYEPVSKRDMRTIQEETMTGRLMEPAYASADEAASVVAESAVLANIGMTVTYDYPAPVTIRNDADALRLRLDGKTASTTVLAEAAPRFDGNAFMVAEGRNELGEPILPGSAILYLDGAMVGRTQLPLIVPGDDLRIGFGRIDGITAELRIPEEEEGGTGIIRRKNQFKQTETLIVRNLTGEKWPLRVVDRVPVSRKEDLEVNWSAKPQPDAQEPDGRRGILFWEAPIEPDQTREIEITTEINWPEDYKISR